MENTATPQMTTTPEYRALCAELVETLSKYHDRLEETYHPDSAEAKELDAGFGVLERARAALAEPAAKEPTVMELVELSTEIEEQGLGQIDFARAVLARWGQR